MSDKGLMTVAEVAEYLGCSRMHVYRLIRAGELAPVNISVAASGDNVTLRIAPDELARFISASTSPAR